MSKKFHIIAAAAFAAVFGGEPTSVRAQQAIWTGRHPDPNVTEASLSQQAVAIAYGHLPPITDEGTSGPPVAYVLGTYEATPGAFQMRVLAYHVDADQPQPQEPFATAVWPATPLGSIVARAMTTATDASGNTWVYVTGQVPSHWGADTITIRYPANLGSTGFWTQRFDNTTRGNDIPVSIAASAGYVAVAVQSSVANMGLDLQVLVYETNTGSYAVDPMVSRISTSHDEWPARVLIDSTVPSIPIVVVAGTMFDTQHFKFVTAAWNPATGLAVWSPTLHGVPNTDCIAMDMAITGTNGPGRAYVTGYSSHAIGNSALTSDYFTTAVSTANGSEPWTALANHGMLYDSPDQSLDQAFKVCTVYNDADLRWKVFVTGSSFANATGNDIVTIKYDDVYDHADRGCPVRSGKLSHAA